MDDMSEKFITDDVTHTEMLLREREQFHNELISTVWMTEYYESSSPEAIVGTAFCIRPEGYLLTCSHNVPGGGNTVEICNLGANGEAYQGKVVSRYPSWDLAIILVNLDRPQRFDFIKFPNMNDDVFCGEEVHSIGNSDNLLRSFLSGRVVCPVDKNRLNDLVRDMDLTGAGENLRPRGNQRTCECLASLDGPFQFHRTVDSVASPDYLSPYAHFHPCIPLIHISNYYAVEGHSGSPVFDNRGLVIGMIFVLHGHFNFALHFRALRHYVDKFFESDEEGRSEKRKNVEGSSSSGPRGKEAKI